MTAQVSLALPGEIAIDRSERDPQDRYYTPDDAIDQLGALLIGQRTGAAGHLWAALASASLHHGGRVLEPSAGGGSLLRGLSRLLLASRLSAPSRVVACDLDDQPTRPLGFHGVEWVRGDFRSQAWADQEFSLSIQNPPFALAEESVLQSRRVARYTLALLRLTFLESLFLELSGKRCVWVVGDGEKELRR